MLLILNVIAGVIMAYFQGIGFVATYWGILLLFAGFMILASR